MSAQALKAVATGAAAQAPQQPRGIFDMMQSDRFKKGIAAVAGKIMTPERMVSLCINAVKKTPLLLQCDPHSVLGAMMASAALGLEPNTIQQQAFLLPYKKKKKVGNQWVEYYECQFQIGARGFVTLAYRSPHIKRLTAETVHANDFFEHMQGSETFLRYAKTMRDRGDPIGAFSHVMLASGEETACILPLEEIHKIRSKSETYVSLTGKVAEDATPYNRKKLDETPWVMWFDDMAAKSAIKKHAKILPISSGDALAVAAELDNRADMGAVDMRAFEDPDAARAVVGGDADIPDAGPHADDQQAALEAPQTPAVDVSHMPIMQERAERVQVAVPQNYKAQTPAQAPAQQQRQQAEPPTFNADKFAESMQAAADKNDLDTLDLKADELRDVQDEDAREMLTGMYQRLRAEVEDRQAGASGQVSLIGDASPAPAPAPASKRGTRGA
jgi:phage RecT family recombinase